MNRHQRRKAAKMNDLIDIVERTWQAVKDVNVKSSLKNAQGQPYIVGNHEQREKHCADECMKAIMEIGKKYDCQFLPVLQIEPGQITPMYKAKANPPKLPGKGNGGAHA